MSETGFADPVEDTAVETVEGGEGESGAPKQSFVRSPLQVLKSLEGRPFEQAVKAIEYVNASRDRERRILKACSVSALNLIAQNGPSYLSAVEAVSA